MCQVLFDKIQIPFIFDVIKGQNIFYGINLESKKYISDHILLTEIFVFWFLYLHWNGCSFYKSVYAFFSHVFLGLKAQETSPPVIVKYPLSNTLLFNAMNELKRKYWNIKILVKRMHPADGVVCIILSDLEY